MNWYDRPATDWFPDRRRKKVRDSQRSRVYIAQAHHSCWPRVTARTPISKRSGPAGLVQGGGKSVHVMHGLDRSMRRRAYRIFTDLDTVQSFVSAMTALPSVRKRFLLANEGVEVYGRRVDAESAYARIGEIHLSRGAMFPLIILHELAHALDHVQGAWHGPWFVNAYIDLVRIGMGTEAADELEEHFQEGGVRWEPYFIRE